MIAALKDTDLMEAESLAELACRLVRFESPQTDRMEMEPAVQAFIGDGVGPLLAAWGLRTRRDAMGSLVCECGPADASDSVIVMTYAMTHPASSMRHPFAGEIVDTPAGPAVRGRGVSEQKGALAASLAALQKLLPRQAEFRRRLVFALCSAGETGRHDAVTHICSSLPTQPVLGIVAIGSNGRIALGNKGRIDIEIEIGGKAGHSSAPWAGINAIDGARSVLERLAVLPLGEAAHPHLGRATLTATSIESWPKATHTIQNRVRLVFDRRLLPGEDVAPAFDAIAKAAQAAADPWTVEVRRGPFMHPCAIPTAGEFMRHATIGHAAYGLPVPETYWSHAALDAGYLQVNGCEASMWGPGRIEQFHADEEMLLMSELSAGAKAYLGFLESALGLR